MSNGTNPLRIFLLLGLIVGENGGAGAPLILFNTDDEDGVGSVDCGPVYIVVVTVVGCRLSFCIEKGGKEVRMVIQKCRHFD